MRWLYLIDINRLFITLFLGFSMVHAHELHAAGSGESATGILETARDYYDDLQYDDALQLLKRVIEMDALANPDLIDAYRFLGFIHLINRDEDKAEQAFRRLLEIEPDYSMNVLLNPPRFVDFFESVQARMTAEKRVVIDHIPPSFAEAGEPVELIADLTDRSSRTERLNAFYRTGETDTYSSVRFVRETEFPDRFKASISRVFTDQTENFKVEYYIAALDDDGNMLASAGTSEEPLSFEVEVRMPEPVEKTDPFEDLTSQWWFWTGAGGAVAVLGGGLALILLSSEPDPPDHGSATLVIR